MLLQGFNNSFDKRTGNALPFLIITFIGVLFVMFIAIATTPLDEKEFIKWKNKRQANNTSNPTLHP